MNRAAREGASDGIGLGEAMGRALFAQDPRNQDYSLLCAAYKSRIPFTAHVTIGGDIAHFHPSADGASLGATSHTDFRLLAELVQRLNGGAEVQIGPEYKEVEEVREIDVRVGEFLILELELRK